MEIVQEFGSTYIVIEDNTSTERTYMGHMITDNRIDYMLQCNKGVHGNRSVLKYDITNMVSLSKRYEAAVLDGSMLTAILKKISEAFCSASEYLLDIDYFIIDPQYIFFDLITDEMFFLFIPFTLIDENDNVPIGKYRALADFFLEKIDHRDITATEVAYTFYRLSKENHFSLEAFCNAYCHDSAKENDNKCVNSELTSKNNAGIEWEVQKETQSFYRVNDNENAGIRWKIIVFIFIITILIYITCITVLGTNPYGIYLKYASFVGGLSGVILLVFDYIKAFLNKKDDGLSPDKNVTVDEYWYEDNETKFFDEEMTRYFDSMPDNSETLEVEWVIGDIRKKEVLSKFPCIIGKKFDEVDVCIAEESVSRIHAQINIKNGNIFLKDLGSTNGTFYNGNRLLRNEEVKITRDSQIRFGKVDVNVV